MYFVYYQYDFCVTQFNFSAIIQLCNYEIQEGLQLLIVQIVDCLLSTYTVVKQSRFYC